MTDEQEPMELDAPAGEPETAAPELVIITGLAGAGRSEAIHTFEDLGYFCIDNLPPAFLSQLVELAELPGSRIGNVAVVCDMRAMSFFDRMLDELDRLDAAGHPYRVLFLEAAERVLVNRFKETRRRHPLAESGTIVEGIRREVEGLRRVRERADLIIDTSDMLPQQLRTVIRQKFLAEDLKDTLAVTVSSFGFKYGPPIDADIVMDVRFLPNPYYMPKLRHRTGQDRAVRDYVMERDETRAFLERWEPLLGDLAPNYLAEGKHHLSIALGCTGGMHRSVVLAEETARFLRGLGYHVSVRHRDINKDQEWM